MLQRIAGFVFLFAPLVGIAIVSHIAIGFWMTVLIFAIVGAVGASTALGAYLLK